MKHTHLAHLMIGVFAIGLSMIPSFARTFGYIGIKSGYSYQGLSKSVFAKDNEVASLDASFASGIPLIVNIGFRRDFNPRFGMRVEAEYGYRFGGAFKEGVLQGALNQGNATPTKLKPKVNLQSLMGNVYWDYYLNPWTNLYIGGGIGLSRLGVTAELQRASKIEKITSPFEATLAWQVGFGLGYLLTGNLGLDVNLRYSDFGKGILFQTQNSAQSSFPFFGIEALIGLSYRF